MNLSRNQRTSEGRDEFNQIFGICITLTNYFLSFNVSLVNRQGIWFYTAIRCVYYIFLCWMVCRGVLFHDGISNNKFYFVETRCEIENF